MFECGQPDSGPVGPPKENLLCAALGAGRGALRRTLLAESLVLCAAGAGLGLLLAEPLVSVAGRYAARFSVRALEATVDAACSGSGRTGAGGGRAARLHSRLPSSDRSGGLGLAGGSVRITPGTNRRLRIFATTQIACTLRAACGRRHAGRHVDGIANREHRL